MDEADRFLEHHAGAIYRALTDAEALEAWLPPADMTGQIEGYQPVVGTGFRMVLTYRDKARRGKTSDASDAVEQTIVELTPDRRVVWAVDFDSADPAYAGVMTMTWTIVERDGGCLLRVAATDVPSGISPDDHRVGMTSSLANLAAYLGATA